MTRLSILVLLAVMALCLPLMAAEEISLPQTDGNHTKMGGEGNAARVHLNTLLACEDKTNSVCRVESQWKYEDIAASQTDQVMGSTGAAGDLLVGIICTTSAASIGVVSVKDGGGASFTLFPAQAGATTLPMQLQNLNWVSTAGAWSITTGTNTTCRASGRFS